VAAVTCLAAWASGCGSGGGEETKTSEPKVDDGATVLKVDPEQPDNGLDEVLETAVEPEDGWVSPWSLAVEPSPDAGELVITYVAGDTQCYGPAGFTLEESDSQVTVGAYVVQVEGAADCPDDPARATKWGTVKLAQPLGERELVHAGVAQLFDGFSWGSSAPPVAPSQTPAQEGGGDADDADDADDDATQDAAEGEEG
jgi:hypothetical protein